MTRRRGEPVMAMKMINPLRRQISTVCRCYISKKMFVHVAPFPYHPFSRLLIFPFPCHGCLFLLSENSEDFEVFKIFRPCGSLLHRNQVIQGGIKDFFIPISSRNAILPDLIEGDSAHRRMGIVAFWGSGRMKISMSRVALA